MHFNPFSAIKNAISKKNPNPKSESIKEQKDKPSIKDEEANKKQDNKKDQKQKSNADHLLTILTNYAHSGHVKRLKATQEPGVWCDAYNRQQLMDNLLMLCSAAEKLAKNEHRVVSIPSPTYCFGDIHGNFRDLIVYSRLLWPDGPTQVKHHFVFLGDFIDRGYNSVEVIIYLFCLKVLSPDKYFLIRGNHEMRITGEQMMGFTFQTECRIKFGDSKGRQLFDAVHRVFDCIPFAAVVDRRVFCSHGGIPMSITKLDQLQEIRCPLKEPQKDAPAVWEMLWSDPVKEDHKNNHQNDDEELRTGYTTNTKRGTAYYFNEEAVDRFFGENQLTNIIRAHETAQHGYRKLMNGKVITVFSSSKYCGGSNSAGCALVDDGVIRIFKIHA